MSKIKLCHYGIRELDNCTNPNCQNLNCRFNNNKKKNIGSIFRRVHRPRSKLSEIGSKRQLGFPKPMSQNAKLGLLGLGFE